MLGTLKEIIDMLFLLWQNEINQQVSQIADLQANVKTQQAETTKARDELKTALTTMEHLKEWFNFERINWDTEKAGLLKRAEDAEAALKPVTEELTGLKRQINAMTSAIFGKYCLPMLLLTFRFRMLPV